MADGTYSPVPNPTFFDGSTVAAGYQLFTYLAGTTTKTATYTDNALSVANANPIVLDANGQATIFVDGGSGAVGLKYVLATAADTDPPASPVWTRDNILAVSPNAADTDIQGVAGETLAAGQPVYVSDGQGSRTTGRWYLTYNIGYASSVAGSIGFALEALTVGQTGGIRVGGRVTGLAGLTAGKTYYTGGATPGDLAVGDTQYYTGGPFAPAAGGPFRKLGIADSTTSLVIDRSGILSSSMLNLVDNANAGQISLANQTLGDARKHFQSPMTFDGALGVDGALAGSERSVVSGVPWLFEFPTGVGNSAGAESTLASFSFPAAVFDIKGRSARIVAYGAFANTASADKRLKLKIGGTTVADTGATTSQNFVWKLECLFSYNAATDEIASSVITATTAATFGAGVQAQAVTALSLDATAGIQILITGDGTNASDTIFYQGYVEYIGGGNPT